MTQMCRRGGETKVSPRAKTQFVADRGRKCVAENVNKHVADRENGSAARGDKQHVADGGRKCVAEGENKSVADGSKQT